MSKINEEVRRAYLTVVNSDWYKRCDWCGWPLTIEGGCVRDNCSMRPMPVVNDVFRFMRLFADALRDTLARAMRYEWLNYHSRCLLNLELCPDRENHYEFCKHTDADWTVLADAKLRAIRAPQDFGKGSTEGVLEAMDRLSGRRKGW